jgi:pyroglutamyl-peptidase
LKKILIAGFEPFDQAMTNPSADWITWMQDKKSTITDRVVTGIILPVTFDTAFREFSKVYDDFKPDFIILTGLAQNRTLLTVERIGINWVDARIPDNAGVKKQAQKIDPQGPDGLFTSIPLEVITKLVQNEKLILKVSTSAGEYVCNDLLYKVLCYTQHKNTQTTFIHLPGLENIADYHGIYLALESLVKGL